MKDTARCKFHLLGMVAIAIATFGPGAAAQSNNKAPATSQPKAVASTVKTASPQSQIPATSGDASKSTNKAQTQTPPKTQSPRKIDGETTFILDPACNACTGASMKLSSRYEQLATGQGANAGKPIHLDLRVDPLKSDDTVPKSANARVSIEGAIPPEIKPGESVAFQVKVTGVLAPGNWTTTVHNGTDDLGEVTFTLPAVTMNLSVEGADAKAPAITLTRKEKTPLVLKNDDATGRPIKWDFQVGTDTPTEKMEGKVPGSGATVLEIEPKEEWFEESQAPVCSGLTSWMESIGIPCNWRAVFKDKETDGLLTLRLASPECSDDKGAPVKIIHLKTTLAYYGANKKSAWSYLVTLVVLLLGALLSLYINFKFPDDQIRGELNQQLKEIGSGIGDLSMRLASRLRVLAGIELRLLEKKLKELRWYTSEFESQRTQIADWVGRLKRRVDLLKKMSRAREDYEHLATLEVPPAVMEKLEDGFEQLGRMLDDFQIADADVQEAEAKLTEMRKLISGWQQPDTTTVAELVALLQGLYDDLQRPKPAAPAPVVTAGPAAPVAAGGAGGGQQVPQVPDEGGALYKSEQRGNLKQLLTEQDQTGTLRFKALSDLVAELKKAPPSAAGVVGPDYFRKALLAFRGDILRKYVLLSDLRAPKSDSPLWKKREVLLPLLTKENWYALRKARRLACEMAEEIYSEDIREQLEAKKAEIRLDRNLVRAFEPALLNVRFHAPKFDTCSARDEWCSTWNFGHGPFDGKNEERNNYLEERGWSVAHYFPGKDKYTLTVRFRHEEAGDLNDSNATPIYVEKDVYVGAPYDQIEVSGNWAWIRKTWIRSKRWFGSKGNAILRLMLALIPAILGMVAGAKDEFLKMDIFLALGAIFLLGFSSDTVKNLLSEKPKT